MRRRWVRVTLVVVLTAAVVVSLLWGFQRRLIFLDDAAPVPPAADVLPGGTDVLTSTDDGLTLRAWFVPPPPSSCPAVFLVAPGNAGNRLARVRLVRALADAGFGALLMEYRGYGGNPGSPSEGGLASDARAAYGYLTQRAGFPAGQVVFLGESLGGAVVTRLAVEHRPAAMVLRSPFTDLAAVAGEHYPFLPVRLLLRDRFPVTDLVRSLSVPIGVVYGSDDSVVPMELSTQVAAAGDPTRVFAVEGADHNDAALVHGPQLVAAAQWAASFVRCPPGR